MSESTIIHLTDNSLAEPIAALCRRILVREARGLPIVCVSQRPVDWGGQAANVVVGEIGRSWRSFYTQVLAALEAVQTETVAIAEHDCLYTHEALAYQPPNLGVFWYNRNHMLVQWPGSHRNPDFDGMYSYWPRRLPFSQLVCSKTLLRASVEEVVRLLEMGLRVEKGQHWYAEPGVIDGKLKKAAIEAESGRPTQLQHYLKVYVTRYDHRTFASTYPSLDIRHTSNYTGQKRGKHRVWVAPYWGRFEDVVSRNA